MSDEEMKPVGATVASTAFRHGGSSRARLEARSKLIAERRRLGRAGTIDEWCQSVVKALPPDKYSDNGVSRPIKHLAKNFYGLVKYLHEIGKLHVYTAFLPEVWDKDTVIDIISGCYPTPRYLSTLAFDYDFMTPEARLSLLKKWQFYFDSDDHDKEPSYFNSLAKYNPIAAAWGRQIWRKKHKRNSTQQDRIDAYENGLRANDISDTLAEMMRIVENEGLHNPETELLIARVTEGDIFADDFGQQSMTEPVLEQITTEEMVYGDEDDTEGPV